MTLNQMSQNFIWKLLQGFIIVNVSEPQNEPYERDGRDVFRQPKFKLVFKVYCFLLASQFGRHGAKQQIRDLCGSLLGNFNIAQSCLAVSEIPQAEPVWRIDILFHEGICYFKIWLNSDVGWKTEKLEVPHDFPLTNWNIIFTYTEKF